MPSHPEEKNVARWWFCISGVWCSPVISDVLWLSEKQRLTYKELE